MMNTLKELAETLRFDYLDEKAARARLALAFHNGHAHEDVSFVASHELINFGPKNDHNGERSAANRVRLEWEERILTPALGLYRRMRQNNCPAKAFHNDMRDEDYDCCPSCHKPLHALSW